MMAQMDALTRAADDLKIANETWDIFQREMAAERTRLLSIRTAAQSEYYAAKANLDTALGMVPDDE